MPQQSSVSDTRSGMLAPDRFIEAPPNLETTNFQAEVLNRFIPSYLSATTSYAVDSQLKDGSRELIRVELFAPAVQTLAVELHLSSKAGRLAGENSRNRYRSFIAAFEKDWFQDYLSEKYPVMREIAAAVVANGRTNATVCLNAFERDSAALRKLLGVGFGEVVDLAPLGDAHKDGLRATRITTSAGGSAILKHRPASADQLVQQLIDVADLGAVGLRLPKRIDRPAYHWQEWLNDSDRRDTPVFAHALGGWLALAHFSATVDLHAENLLASDGAVFGIDVECVGHGIPSYRMDHVPWGSLEMTGILPVRIGATEESPGFNWGAFGSESAEPTGTYLAVIDDNTDQLSLQYSSIDKDFGSTGERTIAQMSGELATGFEEASARIRAHSEAWLRLLKSDHGSRRHVLRATQTYGDAWLKGSHPAALLSRDRFEAAVRASLERSCPPELAALVASDATQVIQRRVPYYIESENGSSIVGHPDIKIMRGFSVAARRIRSELSGQALLAHRATIFRTSAAYAGPEEWTNREWKLPANDSQRDLAVAIVNRIVWDAIPDEAVTWTNVSKSLGGGWRMNRSIEGLYGGDLGILFAVASAEMAGLVTVPAQFIDRAKKTINRIVDGHLSDPRPLGVLEGSAGVQFMLAVAGQVGWIDRRAARSSCDALTRSVSKSLDKSLDYDLLSGSAGVLALYPALVEEGYLDFAGARMVSDKALDQLLATATSEGSHTVWKKQEAEDWLGGLSHGVAGVALGLTRGIQLVSNPRSAETLAKRAWASQVSLLDLDTLDWEDRRTSSLRGDVKMNAWCHGQDGIALAWREMLPLVPGESSLFVQHLNAMALRPKADAAADSSICHGIAGELCITSELSLPHDDQQWAAMEHIELERLQSDREDFSWLDLSLMCGKAGLLWAAAFRSGERLPNPLTLDWRG